MDIFVILFGAFIIICPWLEQLWSFVIALYFRNLIYRVHTQNSDNISLNRSFWWRTLLKKLAPHSPQMTFTKMWIVSPSIKNRQSDQILWTKVKRSGQKRLVWSHCRIRGRNEIVNCLFSFRNRFKCIMRREWESSESEWPDFDILLLDLLEFAKNLVT